MGEHERNGHASLRRSFVSRADPAALRLSRVNYYFNKATGESQLGRPTQQAPRALAQGDVVRCRCEAERRVIPGKYEKQRGADGSLVPLTSLHVRARFWVNESLVGSELSASTGIESGRACCHHAMAPAASRPSCERRHGSPLDSQAGT